MIQAINAAAAMRALRHSEMIAVRDISISRSLRKIENYPFTDMVDAPLIHLPNAPFTFLWGIWMPLVWRIG
jgi:hypothetical protein